MKTLIKRIYAGLIDALLIGVTVGFIYQIFIGQSVAGNEDFKMTFDALNVEMTAITVGVLTMYFIICEIIGQTIGKKILGLKIIYTGKGIAARILRPFIKVITLYICPVIVALSFFLPGNKLFYDYALKTEVTDENAPYDGGTLR
ncbi:MAG: RDD family protein [Ruminococcaceae bacterium]|nr:RDD family protein [Oscillospiraceae bacterium]